MSTGAQQQPGYRYLYDISTATLHDLESKRNPRNLGCGLDAVTDWVSFDTRRSPEQGVTVRKLTATREVMDIDVKILCPRCMEAEGEAEELVELLRDYLLNKSGF